MSDLSNEIECADFIADWRRHYKHQPEVFRERMARIAEEQRANMESCREAGRNVEAYERSVRLLEQAALGDAAEPVVTQSTVEPTVAERLREAVDRLDNHPFYSIADFADDVVDALDDGPFNPSLHPVRVAIDAYIGAVRECADTAGRLPTDDAEAALQGAVEAWLRAHDPDWQGSATASSDDCSNMAMGPQ